MPFLDCFNRAMVRCRQSLNKPRTLVGVLSLSVMTVLAGCGGNVVMNSGTGVFIVTPTSAQFGSITIGQTSSMTVKLVNKTLSPVDISAISLNGSQFSIVDSASFPVTVASGASYSFSVMFSPIAVGTASGQVTVTTNAANTNPTVVDLSGTGTAVESTSPTPTELACTPSSLTGAGTTTCTVSLSVAAPSGGTVVTLTSSNTSVTLPASTTVAAGATTSSFTAQASAVSATQTATLTAVANNVSATTTLTMVAAVPSLSINTSSVTFGNVLLGDTATQDVTLTSNGSVALVINSATLTGNGFLVSSAALPATLQPGQTATVSVAFTPTTVGAASGTLTIASTSASNPTSQVALSGTGVSQAVALTWDVPDTNDVLASYRVYRTTSGSSAYTQIGTVQADTTNFTDSQISAATTFQYYVTSVDSDGLESVPSNIVTLTVP